MMKFGIGNLHQFYRIHSQSNRSLFRWLNGRFNYVDDDKIRDLGPERAAAEWLIRNGAKVVWSKRPDQLYSDYDAIVNDDTDERKYEKDTIIAIDATGSSINHVGFPYLKNLKNLRKIIFNETEFLDNQALKLLKEFQIDLKHLEIIKCFDITDGGILFLKDLRSLEFLKLEQLDSVKNRQYCYDILKNSLDSCKIVWN